MKTFFKDLAERAIKTFAQAMIGALGAGATGLIGVDWIQALSIAGFATLISILRWIKEGVEIPPDKFLDTFHSIIVRLAEKVVKENQVPH